MKRGILKFDGSRLISFNKVGKNQPYNHTDENLPKKVLDQIPLGCLYIEEILSY